MTSNLNVLQVNQRKLELVLKRVTSDKRQLFLKLLKIKRKHSFRNFCCTILPDPESHFRFQILQLQYDHQEPCYSAAEIKASHYDGLSNKLLQTTFHSDSFCIVVPLVPISDGIISPLMCSRSSMEEVSQNSAAVSNENVCFLSTECNHWSTITESNQ